MKEMLELVNKVRIISEKTDAEKKFTGGYFNVFEIAHIETKEVNMCRVIKELIDVRGKHCLGYCFLKLFLKDALHISQEFTEEELKLAVVEREKRIENDRRIDLFIKIADKEIPIEVKIYAEDQSGQCRDYFEYAKNSPIYYLTLDGHMPDEKSSEGLKKEDIILISFKNEIKEWLSSSLKLTKVIKVAAVREILLQFLDVIKKITGEIDEYMNKALEDLLLDSEVNLKNAVLLNKALDSVHLKIRNKVFKSIDEKIVSEYKTERVLNVNDYTTGKGCPGVSYEIGKLENGYKLLLRVELEIGTGLFFAGICVANNTGLCALSDVPKVEMEQILTKKLWKKSSWWIAWKYVKDGIDVIPNFRNYNEPYFLLVNNEKVNSFTDDVIELVDELVNDLAIDYKLELR